MDDHHHRLRRLIDDPHGSPFGRSLIASAQADVPPPAGRARAARRLGIAAMIAAGAGAGSEAGALAAAWKLAAVVVALGGVVGLAIWQSPAGTPVPAAPPGIARHVTQAARGGYGVAPAPAPPSLSPSPSPSPSPSIQTLAAAPSATTPLPVPPRRPSRGARSGPASPVVAQAPAVARLEPPVPAVEAAAPAPAVPAPAMPEPEPAAAVVAAPEVTAPPVPAVVEVAPGPSRLADEVALVDRARARLRAGDHSAAKAALAEYRQRFATGDLDAEADVVTIETLIAEHEVQGARTLGTAFLARFPRSPLAQRVHSLLEHLPK